ncbi:antibiotic biosynthesis monooxygenase [Mesorhizobium sp. C280B]|uniref:putative quinol monooxygenase n=1 Tax=Mesorhizobium sp. C280B TaxID=2956828 RepID=UPI0012EB48F2
MALLCRESPRPDFDGQGATQQGRRERQPNGCAAKRGPRRRRAQGGRRWRRDDRHDDGSGEAWHRKQGAECPAGRGGAARKQSGCIDYSVFRSEAEPNVTICVERWASKQERDAFLRSADAKNFVSAITGAFLERPSPISYTTLEVGS